MANGTIQPTTPIQIGNVIKPVIIFLIGFFIYTQFKNNTTFGIYATTIMLIGGIISLVMLLSTYQQLPQPLKDGVNKILKATGYVIASIAIPLLIIIAAYLTPPEWKVSLGFHIFLFGLFIVTTILIFSSNLKGKGIIAILNITLLIIGQFAYQEFDPTSPVYQVFQGQRTVVGELGTGIGEVFGLVQSGIEKQVALASGDVFTGSVDQQATRRLGVFIENMKSTGTKHPQDQPVNIYATLRAEAFETKDDLNISISCYAGSETNPTPAQTIYPTQTFSLSQYTYEQIDCTFRDLPLGTNTITIAATFDFQTHAYLKTYAMEAERARGYRRQNIDPLEAFGITDKQPIAIYTPGPLGIGMDTGLQPILITETHEYGPTLRMSLDNKWPGQLKEIKSITITTPPGVFVDDIESQQITYGTGNICTGGGAQEMSCTINADWITRNLKNIDVKQRFNTITAHTKLTKEHILGQNPISINNYKISTTYQYTIQQKMDILVTPQ